MTNVTRPEVSESANNDARTVLGAIRNTMDSLSPREKQIAKAIQASPEDILHMTVTDLATRANASESTTVRCCRKLGYNGYQDLKIHLARELSYTTPVPKMSIPSQGSSFDILNSVMAFNAKMLQDVTSTIRRRNFDDAAEAIAGSSNVLLVGFGSSFFVCQEANERLSSVGVRSEAPNSPNMKLLRCAQASEGDVVICVSHTGATKEIIRYADIARKRSATVIAITSYSQSRLSRSADIVLHAGGQEIDFRFDTVSGRLAHLTVLDALCMSMPNLLGSRADESLDIFHDEESSWRL